MPHDRDGRLLAVGDAVLVPCKVEQIHLTEEFCNVTLKTHYPMYPSVRHDTITLNAKQVVKGIAGDPLSPASFKQEP